MDARDVRPGRAPGRWGWLLVCTLAWLLPLTASTNRLEMADRVIVDKSERTLMLMKGDRVLRQFRVALGLSPRGHKEREGDFRTPEGEYLLSRRNPNSDFFLAIQISYPNEADRRRAAAEGVHPGGQIMIHGQPNRPTRPLEYYATRDWTNGCIAVSNADMVDIWLMTPENTPIEIRP